MDSKILSMSNYKHSFNKLVCPENYKEYFDEVLNTMVIKKFECQLTDKECNYKWKSLCPVHQHNGIKPTICGGIEMFYLDIHVNDILEIYFKEFDVTLITKVIPMSFKDSIFPVLKMKRKDFCNCHFMEYVKN